MLKEIQLAESAGFTLNEIRNAMTECNKGNMTPERMAELLDQKLAEIRDKQKELKEVEKMLLTKIERHGSKKIVRMRLF